MAPGTRCWPGRSPRLTRLVRWTGRSRWTPRSIVPISTPPRWRGPSGRPGASQGAEANYTLRAADPDAEPPDHALGRSRGGVSTKIHQLVDGGGRPLVIAVTAGQAGDSPMLKILLADLAVSRLAGGWPRTRPDALLGDKAYSSAGNRELLRRKRVKTVIPQPDDQIAHRKRRGSAGGRRHQVDHSLTGRCRADTRGHLINSDAGRAPALWLCGAGEQVVWGVRGAPKLVVTRQRWAVSRRYLRSRPFAPVIVVPRPQQSTFANPLRGTSVRIRATRLNRPGRRP